jgi:hypothetical protein
MKKVAFIVSHLGAGSSYLIDILNQNPRCTIFQSNLKYEHPEDLNWMFKFHKLKNYSSAIYGDHLLYNHSFSCKNLYKYCKFIYLIRPARQALNEIYRTTSKYSKDSIVRYYRFRLRRICEMAKQTKDAVFITYDDLISGKSFGIIEEYLNLVEPLTHTKLGEFDLSLIEDKFGQQVISKTQDCYEKYYYYLNNLPLRKAL